MAWFSLAGDIPGRAGGVGEDCGKGISVPADRLTDVLVAFELPAKAKELIDNPATHASAHVLTAKDFRNGLGIIPSSGDLAESSATRSLEMNEERTFKARTALNGNSIRFVKSERGRCFDPQDR